MAVRTSDIATSLGRHSRGLGGYVAGYMAALWCPRGGVLACKPAHWRMRSELYDDSSVFREASPCLHSSMVCEPSNCACAVSCYGSEMIHVGHTYTYDAGSIHRGFHDQHGSLGAVTQVVSASLRLPAVLTLPHVYYYEYGQGYGGWGLSPTSDSDNGGCSALSRDLSATLSLVSRDV